MDSVVAPGLLNLFMFFKLCSRRSLEEELPEDFEFHMVINSSRAAAADLSEARSNSSSSSSSSSSRATFVTRL